MISIVYSPFFIRKFNKLENGLQEDVIQKINLFKDRENHNMLDVHKLHGKFKDYFGFSVNYKFRIAFRYVSKNEVLFADIGSHDIYK
ncbi:MAG: Plasmid stabilization system [Candidatus Nomurabacteria bacterium GW2011_GWB1_40_7]|uniref:Plasmid stabilization system n=1 Tax=Candidatus Nomurabacteria bacterium GW2011_GWB1_40_7 TaxID=1618744 RepID=A0A0G0SZW5_9BACT|nr:MAG: Plasmid stabilization system [Candidatus Nomurabacteria bacterium GW2011_GWB1_40_7]